MLKILNVVLLASFKYFWTPPYAFLLELELWETFLVMETGGILGFIFFYYLSQFIFYEIDHYWPRIYFLLPVVLKAKIEHWRETRHHRIENQKKFTWRNRLIIKIRRKWGMWGIIIFTPFLLSIPLGAFLGNKYYSKKKHFLPLMLLSIFIWGIISIFSFRVFPELFP